MLVAPKTSSIFNNNRIIDLDNELENEKKPFFIDKFDIHIQYSAANDYIHSTTTIVK